MGNGKGKQPAQAADDLNDLEVLIKRLTEARAKGIKRIAVMPSPEVGDSEYRILGLDVWDVGPIPGMLVLAIGDEEGNSD